MKKTRGKIRLYTPIVEREHKEDGYATPYATPVARFNALQRRSIYPGFFPIRYWNAFDATSRPAPTPVFDRYALVVAVRACQESLYISFIRTSVA
jgi:hypothetical protein